MELGNFLEDNVDHGEIVMEKYNLLNEINLPSKKKKFPYNIMQITVAPTYKSIAMEHIKGKNLFEKKGGTNKIFVYFF